MADAMGGRLAQDGTPVGVEVEEDVALVRDGEAVERLELVGEVAIRV